jgi:CubicO group peptidase (beta-lactamase class C family)
LRLDDTVDALLPELRHRNVLKRLDGPLDETVPAARPITVRDLLSFRMGFGLVWGPQDAHPIQRAANELRLAAFGPPRPSEPPPPDEWMRRFATLPLMHQPGEKWMYNTAYDVLGVLVARASRQPLETFFRERIFDPLGMKDTAFSVPASKLDRLAESYFANPRTGALELYDPVQGQWSRPPAFPSGAAGLVSTIDDCFALGRMMLRRGGGILSPASVEAMTSDQLAPGQKAAAAPILPAGYGWGFGVSISADGSFGWDGGLGTSWYLDPKREQVAILLTQRGEFPASSAVHRDFWRAANQE